MKHKRSTIKDVAQKSGVSISVVSYVLNNTPGKSVMPETRQRILDAAKELDYSADSIARGMRTKRSMSFGLVSFWKVTDFAFINILDGVIQSASSFEYNVLLCGLKSPNNEFDYVNLFKSRNIDGVILVSPPEDAGKTFNEAKHVEIIKQHNIPSVIINGYTNDERLNYIYIDYYQSSYMATQYLLDLGHTKLAYLLPDEKQICHHRAQDRLNGFLDANAERGNESIRSNIYKFEEMDDLLNAIKKESSYTGVVVNKAYYGQSFLQRAYKESIRIPEDVSVISASTESYNEFLTPALSSVKIPLFDIGMKSIEILMDTMNNKTVCQKVKLPNKLIERSSCQKSYF